MENNQVVKQEKKTKFSETMQLPAIKNLINNTLGDKDKAQRFVASISSAVATNPTLQECSHNTIITSALLGESLNLPPSPQLGFFYMVPFNNNKTKVKEAQFILGWKGYIQLAIRSGQYKKINVSNIKEGELISINPFDEEIVLKPILNGKERSKAKTIGYYAMLELVNGFKKVLYWSKEEMEQHALTYSMGYKAKKGYTFWEKNFDEMANKTLIRQLISKWGIMSLEMQDAYVKDMAVLREDGSFDYVDNEVETLGSEKEIIEQDDVEIDEKTGEVIVEQKMNFDDI